MIKKIEILEKNIKRLEKDTFQGIEIICKDQCTHTGKDVEIKLNGKSLIPKLSCSHVNWKLDSEYSLKPGIISIDYFRRENGKLVVKNDKLVEETLIIDYPIKKIDLAFKSIRIISDNTPMGTEFFKDNKNISKKLGVSSLEVDIGDADSVNEVTLTMC